MALVPKPLDDLVALDRAVDQALTQLQQWEVQISAILHLSHPPKVETGALEPRGDHHVG